MASAFLVVVTTGENADFILLDLIDKAVLLVNAARPAAGKFMFERFGLAGAAKRITLDFLDQLEDTKSLFAVLFDPPGKIFKPGRIKLQAFCGLCQRGCLSCGF